MKVFFINFRNKKAAYLIITMQFFAHCDGTFSFLDIHKLRSSKLEQNRQNYGKKILKQKFHSQPFLINGTTEMASRLGCNKNMQNAQKRIKNKKISKLIASACEAKSREK